MTRAAVVAVVVALVFGVPVAACLFRRDVDRFYWAPEPVEMRESPASPRLVVGSPAGRRPAFRRRI